MKCMKHTRLVVLTCCIVLSAMAAHPATWYVATNGNDSNGGTSWADAVKTIAAGVAMATATHDVVLISNGTYAVTNSITIDKITVRGLNGYANTIADGGGSNQLFYLNGANALLEGLTLTNGYVVSNYAAGVFVAEGTVRDCAIVNCVVTGGHGGGVHMSNGRIEQCLIMGNSAYGTGGQAYGAAIHMYGGVVTGCVIKKNFSQRNGIIANLGGVANNGVIENCTISENKLLGSGAIFILNSAIIRRCMINNNEAAAAAGVCFYNPGKSKLYDSWIVSNTALDGGINSPGGILFSLYKPNAEVRNCLIAYNSGYVGGVMADMATQFVPTAPLSAIAAQAPAAFIWKRRAQSRIASSMIIMSALRFQTIIFKPAEPQPAVLVIVARRRSRTSARNNITNAPLFVDQDSGDFRLERHSPCIHRGFNLPWMIGGVDLDGQPRIDKFRTCCGHGRLRSLFNRHCSIPIDGRFGGC